MFALVLAACCSLAGADPPAAQPMTIEEGAKARYGEVLLREAYLLVNPADISVAELETSLFLARKAALMEPNAQERWRLLLAIAGYAGEVLPAATAAAEESIGRLAQLCPADEQVRLRRLLLEIDRRETAEGRIESFRKLLAPAAVKVIGPVVASRLAYDLALLQSRADDFDGFARSIEQSLSLSPSFPAAADTAAGFISERVDDPVDECELLVNAALANPTEIRGWTRLASLLMQEGANGSAARVLRLAIACFPNREDQEDGRAIAAADLALALWGAGRPQDALQSLRQQEGDARQRQVTLIQTYNPELTRAECEAVPFLVSPLMATINAAIAVDIKDPKAADAIARMVKAAKDIAERDLPLQPTEAPKTPEESAQRDAMLQTTARNLLDAALSAALLGAEAAAVDDLLATAAKRAPTGPEVVARFEAWKKHRSGDSAGALALLGDGAGDQPPVQFLRAECLEATGERKAAARAFLDIARAMRGTMIGVLAARRMESIVGSPLPPKPEVPQLDGLVASIPSTMERYLNGLDIPVRFEVRPVETTVGPFDPIPVEMILTNQTTLPLAVTPTGPVESQVLVQPRLSSASQEGVSRLQPQIIPMDRALQLAPGQSMSMTWDFGWTEAGLRLSQQPVDGGIVDARSVSNFHVIAGAYTAGTFGAMPSMRSINVNGVRLNDAWWDSALHAATELRSDQDMVQVALLAYAAERPAVTPERKAQALDAVAKAFPRMPPLAQAWLVLVGPRVSAGFAPVLDQARATQDIDVRCAYLLAHCVSKDDPQIAAAERSGEALGTHIVSAMRARFERELVRADERMRGQARGARAGATERLKDLKKLRIEEIAEEAVAPQGGAGNAAKPNGTGRGP